MSQQLGQERCRFGPFGKSFDPSVALGGGAVDHWPERPLQRMAIGATECVQKRRAGSQEQRFTPRLVNWKVRHGGVCDTDSTVAWRM